MDTHTLSNGIRLVHQHDDSPVAYLGMVIGTGTRDESEAQQGMAHLVEHMLFKGTAHRKAWHILNRLDSVGGEMNAYTTKEETFLYATVLKEDFERALDLLTDVLFNSMFPTNELEKEIEVVLDEINSYEDSPSDLIYDDFENLLFDQSPIGRNILGKKEFLEKYTSEDLKNFVADKYRTSEMVFFSLGDVNFDKIVSLAEKYLQPQKNGVKKQRIATSDNYRPIKKTIKRHTHQCHYIVGNRAFSFVDEQERMVLFLLNNMLGGQGMNSFLNLSLRERNGLAYTVESNFTSYSDTGVWSVYFGCDKRNTKKCERLMFDELRKVCEKPISDTLLSRMKRQILGQMAINAENKEGLIQSIGKSILYYNRYDDKDEVKRQIESITSAEIQEVAQRVFQPEKLTTLIYE